MTEPVLIGEEVQEALRSGMGVVALETSVIGQGLPSPANLEAASRIISAIRDAGSVPAWVAVLEGAVRVGIPEEDLRGLAEPGRAVKVARRDLPWAVADRSVVGATTVSATVWAAAAAGIGVSATGGIGGVHPGPGGDVSADLLQLATTPGLLVCSGPKSIVDPEATAERLDELGVVLIGYRTDRLPFFLSEAAPVELDRRVDGPSDAAAVLRAARDLGTRSTLLLCNPIPSAFAMDPAEVARAVQEAERSRVEAGVRGAATTPFLLSAIADLTDGRSLRSNLALLEENARVAAEVATALATG